MINNRLRFLAFRLLVLFNGMMIGNIIANYDWILPTVYQGIALLAVWLTFYFAPDPEFYDEK